MKRVSDGGKKNAYARQMIEKEQALNKSLEIEIRSGERQARELDESRHSFRVPGHLKARRIAACLMKILHEIYQRKIAEITGYPPSDFIDNCHKVILSVIFPEDISLARSVIF